MNIPEIVKVATLQAFGAKASGLTITPRSPLDFQSNRLYDLWAGDRHFIAKEYVRPDEAAVAPAREYKSLQVLATMDIAPQPVFFDPDVGPVVIYEYLEGEMWNRRAVTGNDLSKLASVWIKMSAAPVDWVSRNYEYPLQALEPEFYARVGSYLQWTRAHFAPGAQTAELCLKLLEGRHAVAQELAEYAPRLCFCRGDPRFANVIQRPDGRLGLVDWEDGGLHDPAQDAAVIVTHPNQEDLASWETWQAFLRPYISFHSRTDPDIAYRTQLYLALCSIFWLTVFIQRGLRLAAAGQLPGWTINELPANERLRRYLAWALAWPDMRYELTLRDLGAVEFFPEAPNLCRME